MSFLGQITPSDASMCHLTPPNAPPLSSPHITSSDPYPAPAPGHFQGIARMMSPIGGGPRMVPWVGLARPDAVRNFLVRWEIVHALPFQAARNIYNPLNEGALVYVGRDGQEIHPIAGQKLLQLMREEAERALQAQRGGGGPGAGGGKQPPPPPPQLPRAPPRLGQQSQQLTQQATAAAAAQQQQQATGRKAFEDMSFDEYLEAFRAVRRRIKELEEIKEGVLGPGPGAAAGGGIGVHRSKEAGRAAAGAGGGGGGLKRPAPPSARPGLGPGSAPGGRPTRGGLGGGGGGAGTARPQPPPPAPPGVGMGGGGGAGPMGMGPGGGGGMLQQMGPGGMVMVPPQMAAAMRMQMQMPQMHIVAANVPPEQ